MATPAFYRDGIPYAADGSVIITITGGPTPNRGTIPGSRPVNGGFYTSPFPANIAPAYLKDRLNVQYAPNSKSFTPYAQITLLQKKFDAQIAEARKHVEPPITSVLKDSNAAIRAVQKKEVGFDEAVEGAAKKLTEATQGLQEAKAKLAVAEKNVTQKHNAAELALKKTLPKLGLTKVNPLDYDLLLSRVLQPVSRRYWEEYAVKPRVEEFNAKQQLIGALDNIAVILKDVIIKTAALAKETNQVADCVKLVADFYQNTSDKFGEHYSALSKELARSAKGKNIRNVDQALQSFEKYKDVLNKKYSVEDRKAIVKAFESVDHALMANNLVVFSKGLKVVGKSIDYLAIYQGIGHGLETGDWKPVFLKTESMIAGKVATAAVVLAFATLTATPVGILGYALIMAIVGALIDEKLMDRLNSLFV